MSKQLIEIDTELSADGFKSVCDLAPGQLEALISLENYFAALAGGNQSAQVSVKVGAVQATATIVSSGTAADSETMRLCNQVLTAKTSGADPVSGEFNISATPATQASSIALAINSVVALQPFVSAIAEADTVIVTAKVPGALGNGLECINVDLDNVTVNAFSGGSDGTTYVIND